MRSPRKSSESSTTDLKQGTFHHELQIHLRPAVVAPRCCRQPDRRRFRIQRCGLGAEPAGAAHRLPEVRHAHAAEGTRRSREAPGATRHRGDVDRVPRRPGAARRPERRLDRLRHRGRSPADLCAGRGCRPGLRGQPAARAHRRGHRGAQGFQLEEHGRAQGQACGAEQGLQCALPAGQGAREGRPEVQRRAGGLLAACRCARGLRAGCGRRLGDLGPVPRRRRKAAVGARAR